MRGVVDLRTPFVYCVSMVMDNSKNFSEEEINSEVVKRASVAFSAAYKNAVKSGEEVIAVEGGNLVSIKGAEKRVLKKLPTSMPVKKGQALQLKG